MLPSHFWSSIGRAGLTSVSPDSVVHLDVRAEFPNGSHHLPDLQSQLVGGSQAEALAGEQRKELSGLGWGTPGRDSKRSSGTSQSTEAQGTGQHSIAGGSGAGLCSQLQLKGQKEAAATISEKGIPLPEGGAACSCALVQSCCPYIQEIFHGWKQLAKLHPERGLEVSNHQKPRCLLLLKT